MAPAHVKIISESTGIVETSGYKKSVKVLRDPVLARWPVYHAGAHRGAS
jgi:hypothetical protein